MLRATLNSNELMTTCTLNKLTGTHSNTFVMANTSSGKWYTNALGGLGRANVLKG